MKKRMFICITVLILAVLLVGCTSADGGKTSREKANLNALLEDLYGSDAIVCTPESSVYVQLTAAYVNQYEHSVKAVQLNTTPEEEDFYQGELYSCIPAKDTFSKGEPVEITVTSRNPNPTSGGAMYRLDMLADGEWYTINRLHVWPTMEYCWENEGSEISYRIDEYTLYRFSPLQVDAETGLFAWGEADPSPVTLPEGTYRFSTWVIDEEVGGGYRLVCQFHVK